MKDKSGRGKIESIITAIFGTIIIIILLTSGFISQIFSAFSGFGSFGGILAILFILMIVLTIWEAFRKK